MPHSNYNLKQLALKAVAEYSRKSGGLKVESTVIDQNKVPVLEIRDIAEIRKRLAVQLGVAYIEVGHSGAMTPDEFAEKVAAYNKL